MQTVLLVVCGLCVVSGLPMAQPDHGYGYHQPKCRTQYQTTYKTTYETSYKPQCETVYKEECHQTYEDKCSTSYETSYKQECSTSYREECKEVGYGYHKSKQCHKVPQQHCQNVP